MTSFPYARHTLWFSLFMMGTVLVSSSWAAPMDKATIFNRTKKEITTLVLARVRAVPMDTEKVLKMGEERLRTLHENYKLAKSTPPTTLANDVSRMTQAAQRLKLLRSRGQNVPENPIAKRYIKRHWKAYETEMDEIKRLAVQGRRIEKPEGQLYWSVMKRFEQLKEKTEKNLLLNNPSGGIRLQEALAQDEWLLLKAIESPGRKTQGTGACVVAQGENPRQAQIEAGPFYHSQGMLPTYSPRGVGAFTVPAGCRTVTERNGDSLLVFRVSQGKGIAYIGSEEKPLTYGYTAIPPDVPYYFENTEETPLDLEFVALPPTE